MAKMDRRSLMVLGAWGAVLGGAGLLVRSGPAAEEARLVPPPVEDPAATAAESAVAVLAGGCFWGVQGVYQHVQGVTAAISGYAGGGADNARYELVGTGRTGHAEAVEVRYDPARISYGRILQVFFSVAHDPTQLDRQGPDVGPQYRSAIFPTDAAQAQIARAYLDQLGRSGVFARPIVTRIEPEQRFYVAEYYHQDFLARNPTHPYIVRNDLPKIADLERLFPALYRAEPVLALKPATG